MPEKVGKYQILERIGRGGMGTIFKAHDPVLDRFVAVKVISREVEITDGLRARFFREAQACARLSHPHIVTVHDMGEDDGRLFIVMELLDGTELRRVIAEESLALEDKLSIMTQVCDGLQYAHQRGIVHRDVKPGNMMLLRNGSVKILDFGVAQIANTDGGLTRTGLIMGTLRYIAPEQVQGRSDHRSDIFSVGAVFYELLSGRPPFSGENAMQILEQLRTAQPLPLTQLGPGVPPSLAAAVERAMRKDPAERFQDLGQMRVELEQVRRELAEECQRVRARLRVQFEDLSRLQQAVAERIGTPAEAEPLPTLDEREPAAKLQAFEREIIGRAEALRAKVARADALAPALARAMDLLGAGHAVDAVAELAPIVAEMPEHARASQILGRARVEADGERRRQLVAELVHDAQRAIDKGGYALGVALLKQAEESPAPADAARIIASLRGRAEAELAAHEAAHAARHRAELAREQMARAQRGAQAWAASQYATAIWTDAEAQSARAHDAFARDAYDDAREGFDRSAALYRQCEKRVQEVHRSLEGDRPVPEAAEVSLPHGQDLDPSQDTTTSAPAEAVPASADVGCDATTLMVGAQPGDSTAGEFSGDALGSPRGPDEEAATVRARVAEISVRRSGRWLIFATVGVVSALGALVAIVLTVGGAWLKAPDLLSLASGKVIKGADGSEMVLVPPGEFWMGSSPAEVEGVTPGCRRHYSEEACKEWFDRETPRHRVFLDGFYIDRFEVTNALFERFVRATGHSTTAERLAYGWVWQTKDGKWQRVRTPGAEWRKPTGSPGDPGGNHPVVQVSWHDAVAYCRWAGKRLPSEAEWEKSARGTGDRPYPWGSSWDTSMANGALAVWTTKPVGSYPTGVSPYGIHDLAGNVHEWIGDWFDPTYYERSAERNPPGPERGESRVLRGGSWLSAPPWQRVSIRFRDVPDGRSDLVGFRCAKGL